MAQTFRHRRDLVAGARRHAADRNRDRRGRHQPCRPRQCGDGAHPRPQGDAQPGRPPDLARPPPGWPAPDAGGVSPGPRGRRRRHVRHGAAAGAGGRQPDLGPRRRCADPRCGRAGDVRHHHGGRHQHRAQDENAVGTGGCDPHSGAAAVPDPHPRAVRAFADRHHGAAGRPGRRRHHRGEQRRLLPHRRAGAGCPGGAAGRGGAGRADRRHPGRGLPHLHRHRRVRMRAHPAVPDRRADRAGLLPPPAGRGARHAPGAADADRPDGGPPGRGGLAPGDAARGDRPTYRRCGP